MDRAFNMTRDGFTLLAMGFTGEKALGFKMSSRWRRERVKSNQLAFHRQTYSKPTAIII